MATYRTPKPGNWFINLSGQHMYVWGIIFDNQGPEKIVLRYQSGLRKTVALSDWNKLDLINKPLPSANMGSMTGV